MRRRLRILGRILYTHALCVVGTVWILSFWKWEEFCYSDGDDNSTQVTVWHGAIGVSAGQWASTGPDLPPKGIEVSFFRHWGAEAKWPNVHFPFPRGWTHGLPPNPFSWKVVPWHPRRRSEWADRREWDIAGVQYIRGLAGFSDGEAIVFGRRAYIPAWIPGAILLAALMPYPVALRRSLRRRRHRRRGECGECGYMLCGINERCPECGTLIPGSVVMSKGTPGLPASAIMEADGSLPL